jgi:Fe-S-cluster containining protein
MMPDQTVPEAASGRPPIPVPPEAKAIDDHIVELLKALKARDFRSCLDPQFVESYRAILDLFSRYQEIVLGSYQRRATCRAGCSFCCYHWVEDVYSFEAAIIADYLQRILPSQIERIVAALRQDEAWLERLDRNVGKRLRDPALAEQFDDADWINLLLGSFYQLKRLCPLIDAQGFCSIYALRPLTCRAYMSFFDPSYCKPAHIDIGNPTTYLLEPGEEASALMDELHFRYVKVQGDTSLRSQLLRLLTQDNTAPRPPARHRRRLQRNPGMKAPAPNQSPDQSRCNGRRKQPRHLA